MSREIKIETLIYTLVLCLLYIWQYNDAGYMYIDTDNYMHALRALDFWHNPSFLEHRFMQTNYPFGEISHWTKLMDIIMVLCALPFMLFQNAKEAIFNGGFLLTPLCAIGVLYFLQKIGAQWLNFRSRLALYLMLLSQAQFKIAFKVERPDHHAVILFMVVWLLWLLCDYLQNGKKSQINGAAVLCAAALWLAAEGLFLYAVTLAFLYVAHLFLQKNYQDLIRFSAIYAGVVCCFWIMNPPLQGWFFLDNGRLSVIHAALSVYVAVCVFSVGKIQNEIGRFFCLSIAGFIGLAVLWFGGFLTSPLDERIAVAFTNRVSEMNGGNNIYYLAYPVLGMLSLAALWKYQPQWHGRILLLFFFLLPYTLLSIWAMRFLNYALLLATISVACWLTLKTCGKLAFAFLTLFLCLVEFICFIITSMMQYDLFKPLDEPAVINVNFFEQYKFSPGAVVTDIFLAPYVLWYAERPTVASPYHRNHEGILDNHEILMNPDMDRVATLVKKHSVGTIVLPHAADEKYYVDPHENCDKLYGKILACGQYPAWLKEDTTGRRWGYTVLKVIPENLPE